MTIAALVMGITAVSGLGVASALLTSSHPGASAGALPGGAAAPAGSAASAASAHASLTNSKPFGTSSPAVIAALSHVASADQPGSWAYGLTHPDSALKPLTSLPNLDLLEHPLTSVSDVITPGYLAQPAPLGLGDYGLGAHTYAYNTPHIVGAITFLTPPNATDPGSTGVIEPGGQSLGYVGSVDEFGIQLNTVLTNVSLQGNTLGVFWTQNVVNWNATGIHFVSDTFNFSNGEAYIPAGTIVSGCDNNSSGAQNILNVYGGVFQCVGGTIPLSPAAYPVTIQLYNNASVNTQGQDVLNYSYYIDEAGIGATFSGTSDQLVFNDTGDAPAVAPPAFSVNGFTPSPLGLPEDAEIDLVGDIGGDNAVFSALNASITLQYSNASKGGFQSVPSAYNFGIDTGETSTGIADYWTPAHVLMANQGPAMLYGLWNAVPAVSVNPGHIQISGSIDPSYGYVFVSNTPPVADPFALGAPADNFSFVPTEPNGSFSTDLPPVGGAWTSQYYVQAFAPGSAELNGTPITAGVSGYTLTLASDPGSLNAPLQMFSAAEASALAFNISHSASAPYTFANLNISPNASFDHLNDYQFPSFEIFTASGVGSVSVSNLSEGQDSPLGNLYFWDGGPSTSVLVGVPEILGPYPDYTAQVNLYFGSGDSASNLNLTGIGGQGGLLLLWGDHDATVSDVTASFGSGGVYVGDSVGTTVKGVAALFGAAAVQDVGSTGTSATGISASLGALGFEAYSSQDESISWLNVSLGAIGIEAGEAVALLYDTTAYYNLVGTNGLAVSHLGLSGAIGAEIEVSSAVSLTGVTSVESELAEFVASTGVTVTNVLSTDDSFGLYFFETNFSQVSGSEFLGFFGTPIIVEFSSNDTIDGGNVFFMSVGVAVEIYGGVNNHVYDNAFLYNDGSGAQYSAFTPQALSTAGNYFNSSLGLGNFWSDWHHVTGDHLSPYVVSGTLLNGVVDEHPTWTAPGPVSLVTFTETGLPAKVLAKHPWTVYFDGIGQTTTNGSLNYSFPVGTFPAFVYGPSGWVASPALSSVTTTLPTKAVSIAFAKGKTATLTFKVKGLPADQSVLLLIEGAQFQTTNGMLKIAGLSPGSYSYEVVAPLVGQTIVGTVGKTVVGGASGTLTLTKSEKVTLTFSYYFPVEFTESGLLSGDHWSVTIKGQTESAIAPSPVWFNLTNGTYHYTAKTTATGYHAHPASGRLIEDGQFPTIPVTFVHKGGGSQPMDQLLLSTVGRSAAPGGAN